MDKQTNVGEYTGHGLEFSEALYWLTERYLAPAWTK